MGTHREEVHKGTSLIVGALLAAKEDVYEAEAGYGVLKVIENTDEKAAVVRVAETFKDGFDDAATEIAAVVGVIKAFENVDEPRHDIGVFEARDGTDEIEAVIMVIEIVEELDELEGGVAEAPEYFDEFEGSVWVAEIKEYIYEAETGGVVVPKFKLESKVMSLRVASGLLRLKSISMRWRRESGLSR
ncbi:hypothetical protein AGMMS49531_00780 [Endomicrobiia bacterium]|nr:hypothetical protein AGMMS49531_00780 [Endomicrobiia bacterium]